MLCTGNSVVVTRGDTLSGIAYKLYGNAALWPLLSAANRDQVANPNLIVPGEVLRLPY
jgi:nucleoid-associated protein YgaU